MADSSIPPATAAPRSSRPRTVVDLAVCLIILVTLFRTYLAGGYMIETGSMAPCLLGKHRPAVCPSCKYRFAVEGAGTAVGAVCPNCGQDRISLDGVMENDGDHLLVHRGAYELRSPRRWEVIVFQNPSKPRQAYVKRVAGLPGESVQIKGGDVFVGGEIQTKDYATQRGVRIPVYDHNFRPPDSDPEWQPRWVIEGEQGRWRAAGGAFLFTPVKGDSADALEWLKYRNWLRHGGAHKTSVPFAAWPKDLDDMRKGFGPLQYDEESQTLVCRGAMSQRIKEQLLAGVGKSDSESRAAIERLFEASHLSPITDGYGYNGARDGLGRHEVRDLMLSVDVRLHEGQGEFVLALSDGTTEFQCLFDRTNRKVRLIEMRTGRTLRTAPLAASLFARKTTVEISLMDRQALVVVEGKLAFEPWKYPAPAERGPTPWAPARIGARGAAVEIDSLKLFRDVYYSDDVGRRGTDEPAVLAADEYFVLGDNSPVSKDSRSWTGGTMLTGDLLLGKPLVVHLPSRKKRVRIAGWQTEIRIPEFSRMRYIH